MFSMGIVGNQEGDDDGRTMNEKWEDIKKKPTKGHIRCRCLRQHGSRQTHGKSGTTRERAVNAELEKGGGIKQSGSGRLEGLERSKKRESGKLRSEANTRKRVREADIKSCLENQTES